MITKASEHSCKILFEMGALLHITLFGLNRLHKKTGYNAILIKKEFTNLSHLINNITNQL